MPTLGDTNVAGFHVALDDSEGQVVSRQEIVERLWGKDVFVDTEHGINTAIRKIRTALGEKTGRMCRQRL